MKRLTYLSLAFVACVATCAASSEARTELPTRARNGPIYFEKNNDLYAIDSNGAHLRPITRSRAQELDPTASPDGSEIAFRSGSDEIFRIGVDGRNRVNLTRNGAHDLSPAWGPTGRIAFASTRGGTSAIWTMDRRGRRVRKVSPADGEYPAWSRDGKWLAFSRPSGATYDLWVMRSDGSRLKQLTNTIVVWEGLPSWAPDNRTIVFSRGDPNGGLGGRKLWTIDRDGGDLRRLTSGAGKDDFAPSWSPDGKSIAFTRNNTLFVMRADGTDVRSLGIRASLPDWGVRNG